MGWKLYGKVYKDSEIPLELIHLWQFEEILLIIIVGYSDSIVKNFGFFPEALTRKSKTNAYMENLL